MTGMTDTELRTWLRTWISDHTDLDPAEITDDRPLDQLGLSSRDAVLLSGELETLTGTTLTPTVVYEHPTIAALAAYITAGPAAAPTPVVSPVAAQSDLDRDIAIVGMAVRYPGAPTLDALWDMLITGADGITEPPAGRWAEYESDPTAWNRMHNVPLAGGYLEDIASFDNEFFGISPVEAANMDPQQRLLLETTWEALAHAGIPADTLRGTDTGVYVGTTNNDYGMLIATDSREMHPYALTGCSSAIMANRISYAFDFRGPSLAIDTACSSSLVAIHDAVRALRAGDTSLALAGGVNILSSPAGTTAFGELGVLSPTGRIRAFSDDADGIVRSDGVGMLVLKRASDARRDGDTILALIKGTAVNSDGRSNGLTAPNPEAQADVLARAYSDAGINPADVDYVEAHGTGTLLGDPIEATALGRILGAGRGNSTPLLLGSAKTNLGHTEAAAGVAGVAKVVLAMMHDILPPTANFNGPNPYIDFDANHLEVVEDPREWPAYSGTAIAGVSGFGFGGTNAHVVLAAPGPADRLTPQEGHVLSGQNQGTVLLPVSGLLPSRRKAEAVQLLEYVEGLEAKGHTDAAALVPLERALAARANQRARAAAVVADVAQAKVALSKIAAGARSGMVITGEGQASGGQVWVYSGFGSQHRDMGRELYEASPVFRQTVDRLNEVVVAEGGWDLVAMILDPQASYDTTTAQVGITVIQIAMTDMMRAAGVVPDGVVGMSMGEIAAAYAAGGLTATEAVTIACHRARLMGEGEKALGEGEQGGMAVVELSVDELDEFIGQHPEFSRVEPAVYASPQMTTVGGPYGDVEKLTEVVAGQGKFARMLKVKGAGHTSMLNPILGELWAECSAVEPRPLEVPLYSSVDRGVVYPVGAKVHDADYWVRCTRQSVWFGDAVTAAFEAGASTVIEFSPNPVALMQIMQCAFAAGVADADLLYMSKRKESALENVQTVVQHLWAQGRQVDLKAFVSGGPVAQIPPMPWKRQHLWTAARPAAGAGAKVALPDGRVAWAVDAGRVESVEQVLDVVGVAGAVVVEHQGLPADGELTVLVAQTLGGVSVQVFAGAVLVAEAFAATAAAAAAAEPAVPAEPVEVVAPNIQETRENSGGAFAQVEQDPGAKWDPASGESVADRLSVIVSEAMGYELEDIPLELPLIDLGLDSLMGMRIKNRIEYEFSIPPLQVQALRDASVKDVIAMVEAEVAGVQPVADTQPAPEAPEAPEAQGVGVAPRDASERMVFGTWSKVMGAAPAGVTSPLAQPTKQQAQEIAQRLSERSGAEISEQDVLAAKTLEPLANLVRESFETDVEGNIRVLRERAEGSTAPAVFLFHPAGGSSTVYQPLARRLPADAPVYGVERLEGPLAERAEAYVEDIRRLADGRPVILGGWSFGGFLAYEVAHRLLSTDVEVAHIVLLDAVQAAHPAPNTLEEIHARWDRYSAFCLKTYGLELPVPHDLIDEHGEEVVLQMLQELLATTDPAEHGLSAGVLEHQRASFADNRIMHNIDFSYWADVTAPVTLFRAERMHDGAVELEPSYAEINEDGGWAGIVKDLEIIHLHGDHLAVVDEPEISTVGARVSEIVEGLRR